MEILVIQTAFPGDLFLSLPLLKQIKFRFPSARLSLLCREGLGQTFLTQNIVDEIFEIKKGNSKSYSEVGDRLKAKHFKIIICPHRSFRTAVMVRSLNADFSVAFRRWWNFPFFSKTIKFPKEMPDALRQLSLLGEASSDFKLDFERLKENPERVKELLGKMEVSPLTFPNDLIPEWASMDIKISTSKTEASDKDIIYLAPGSVWATKKWKVESFQALAIQILNRGYRVVLTGAKADSLDCERVAQADPRIENLCGKTSLNELLSLFSKAKALVANDSGAIHMAASVGLPTVAIFGPTVPEFGFRPWNKNSVVMQLNLGCRPCSPHGTAKCPIGTHACMRDLEVDKVFGALINLLNTPSH